MEMEMGHKVTKRGNKEKASEAKKSKTEVRVEPVMTKTDLIKMRYKEMRDPLAPEKPIASYVWFFLKNKIWEESAFKSVAFKERMKESGRRWRALSEADRQEYKDFEVRDKIRYKHDMAIYLKQKWPKFKRKRDPLAPKNPRCSFNYFCSNMSACLRRERVSRGSSKEWMQMLGKEWRKISLEERRQVEALAAKDKQRYRNEMWLYLQKKRVAAERRRKRQDRVRTFGHRMRERCEEGEELFAEGQDQEEEDEEEEDDDDYREEEEDEVEDEEKYQIKPRRSERINRERDKF